MLKYFPTGIHFVTTGVYAGLLKASSAPRDRRPFHHSFGHNYYVKVAVTGEAYYIYMYTPHNFLWRLALFSFSSWCIFLSLLFKNKKKMNKEKLLNKNGFPIQPRARVHHELMRVHCHSLSLLLVPNNSTSKARFL